MDNEYILKKDDDNTNKYAPVEAFRYIKQWNFTRPNKTVVTRIAFENNYYDVTLDLYRKNEEIPIDISDVSFIPKDVWQQELPNFTSDGIVKINKKDYNDAGSFAYPPMTIVCGFFDVDDTSDIEIKIAKESAIEFDKLIRSNYPGYCFVPKISEIKNNKRDSDYMHKRIIEKNKIKHD